MPLLPRLLICEGAKDSLFFQRLIAERQLPNFHIWPAGGISKFYDSLNKFNIERTNQFRGLSHILFVADNDETPQANFDSIRAQIDRFFKAQVAPATPLTRVARAGTRPSLTILMMPWAGVNGHLEKLCVEAARDANRGIAEKVDTFMATIHSENWNNESRVGKAWLRTSLAARCASDPFVPLGRVFEEAPLRHLIPVAHPSFDPIADVLRTF
jgi:hypothetical protein